MFKKKKKKKKAPPKEDQVQGGGQQAQWSAFSDRKLNIEKVATVQSRAPQGEMNVASLASAAMARQRGSSSEEVEVGGDDVLASYRKSGEWDAGKIVRGLFEEVEPTGKRARRDATPAGLTAAARATVASAIWGEVKGLRQLASTLSHAEPLDDEGRRSAEGIARAVGSRKLGLEHLRTLTKLCVAVSGERGDALLERACRLVDLRVQPRAIGDLERSVVSPRQLLDIRALEAVLVVVDMPVREATSGRRPPSFERVVVLLRDIKNELVLIDPIGLYDPSKGANDRETVHATMRKPDEMALREFLAGAQSAAPASPIARLSWAGYLSSVAPRALSSIEILALRAKAFRFS